MVFVHAAMAGLMTYWAVQGDGVSAGLAVANAIFAITTALESRK